ncbi:hypothetical protein BG006_004242 [Podila minutissima]|uniref:SPX domain-containing protein n=1 Tax=Podila minutissima TaxID=64525 RepID=A0A9P5VMU2_9FUNG|nr:hypothetical protein BG006_004242 [Podila minutissima]
MKFGKALETNAEAMPEGWRPYVIHYKALKKKINAIVQELEDRGLPSPIIKNLLSKSMNGDTNRMEYSFDEDKEHLKTCIKVVLDDLEPSITEYGPEPLSQEDQLSRLLAHELAFLNTSASSSTSDLHEQLALSEDGDTAQDKDGEHGTKSPRPGRIGLGLHALQDRDTEDEDDDNAYSEASSDDAFPALPNEGHDPNHQTAHGPTLSTWAAGTPSLSMSTISSENSSVSSSSSSSACTSPTSPLSSSPSSPPPELSSPVSPSSSPNNKAHRLSFVPSPSPLSQPPIQSGVEGESSGSASKEEMETVVTSGAKLGKAPRPSPSNTRITTTEEDGKRVLVIELTADTAFFDQLGEEVSQLSKLQQSNKQEFESKVEDLSKMLTVVSSPQNKDMYTWREILNLYLDAQVFVGDQETDRSTRSSEKAQKQLQWFLKEMERSKLIQRFKLPKSKVAFNTFFQLNSELITMKQFKELNQMAMTKILKKHDKRTNLLASSGFPKHLQNEPFYNDNISKSLTYTIGCQLVSIIPQPDDYACPICMSVAWKPIRLNCSHVFCVRCLIKAQRKKMVHCPVCRQHNSVLDADASNLDVSLMNFLKLYFPKEIKEKRKDSSREQAAEELEAITGQRWTDAPEGACVIM